MRPFRTLVLLAKTADGNVVPAKAGTQGRSWRYRRDRTPLDSRLRGNDGRRPRASSQRGFSLLEVLVAFVILALVATALFRLIGGALGNAGVAADVSRAVLVAQSRLDAARGNPRLAGESGSEDDGRIAWTTTVEPYTAQDLPADPANLSQVSPTQLYRIRVEVRYPGSDGRDRTLALNTLRIAPREIR